MSRKAAEIVEERPQKRPRVLDGALDDANDEMIDNVAPTMERIQSFTTPSGTLVESFRITHKKSGNVVMKIETFDKIQMSNGTEITSPRVIEQVKEHRQEEGKQTDAVASFDDLNTDVLVNILSFLNLTRDEMDDISVLSRGFAEARNHPSFDQTRTATIVCKSGTTILDLYKKIASKGWAEGVFSSDSRKKRLKIIGLESLKVPLEHIKRKVNARTDMHLQSVTSLDVSASPSTENTKLAFSSFTSIARILPNLKELDMNYGHSRNEMTFEALGKYFPKLTRVQWLVSYWMRPPLENVNQSEIYMDRSVIHSHYEHDDELCSDMTDQENYFFNECPSLERLSIKNVSYTVNGTLDWYALSQDHLIKLVRLHPTLRWLRSDLTDENIAMLNIERPEVTLVNE